jgi:hypothetical protein
MRKFVLFLNGSAIADYFTRGRAENAFARRVRSIGNFEVLELVDIVTGHRLASSI